MPLIMSGLVSIWVFNNIDFFKDLNLINTILFWLCFSIGMGLSLIPTTIVALLAGFIWGFISIIPLIISYIIATIIGANLSKWIDNDQILNQIQQNSKANTILSKLKNEQFKIVALARLSPVFPFGISNVVFTYLGVPLRTLLFAGLVGMLPRTIFMVYLASKAESLQILFTNNWWFYLQNPVLYIGVASIVALIYILIKAFRNSKN